MRMQFALTCGLAHARAEEKTRRPAGMARALPLWDALGQSRRGVTRTPVEPAVLSARSAKPPPKRDSGAVSEH